MFLSRFLLSARHQRTKSEIERPYELHRTLSKGFAEPQNARILFRAEKGSRMVVNVIVQSLAKPDWSRLTVDSQYLIDIDGPKEVNLDSLQSGQALCFRLQCKPTMRIAESGHPDKGQRKSLKTRHEIFAWLCRKAEANGFEVVESSFDRVYWVDTKDGKNERSGGVIFDGILRVKEPEKLREAIKNGIGTQKAFGFGLLSIAPIK